MPTHSTPDSPPQNQLTNTDSPSYDLEFRSTIDDAWYSAHIVINDDNTLVVKLLDFPKSDDERFSVGDSTTVDDVDAFVGRFRPISEQLQDSECGKVTEGIEVCASFTFATGDVRYYDAIVESVIRKKHLFGKEEECKCEFLLYWQQGSHKGMITAGSIANICMIQPFAKTDSRLASFSKMAKKKIKPSASSSSSEHSIQDKQVDKHCLSLSGRTKESTRISKLHEYSYQDIEFAVAWRIHKYSLNNNLEDIGCSISTGENLSMSFMGEISKKYSSLSRRGLQDKEEAGQFLGSFRGHEGGITERLENSVQFKDSGGLLGIKKFSSLLEEGKKISCLSRNDPQVIEEERDGKEFRRPAARTGGLSCAEEPAGHHFIIVGNLEKDLSPSSIAKFIQKHTSISPQACILPSLSSELYARGVIETDSEEKLEEICKFLQNPNHIITSSKGRPWFVHNELSSCETFETTLGGAMTLFQDKTSVEELKIVYKGAPEYRVAKRMRDIFEAFAEHQERLHKRFAWEEKQVPEMVDDATDGIVATEAAVCMSAYFRGTDQISKLEQLKELAR